MNDYPSWACIDCIRNATHTSPDIATYHINICDVCGRETHVTSPKKFGFPQLKTFRQEIDAKEEM